MSGDSLEEWWDEDADRINKLAESARKFAAKIPEEDEEERAYCPTGEGGGLDNSCSSNPSGGGDAKKSEAKPEKKAEPLTPESIPKVSFSKTDDGEAFLAARDESKRPENFSDISPERLAKATKFMSGDGKSGCLVDEDGDLGNVFNNGDTKAAGMAAVLTAIEHGAETLDCYDDFLPGRYAQVGFVAVAKAKWDDKYAPPNWDYAAKGRPDVVIMAYRGGDRSTIRQRVGSFKPYEQLPDDRYTDDPDAAKRTARLSSDSERRTARLLRSDAEGSGRRGPVCETGSPEGAGRVRREPVASEVRSSANCPRDEGGRFAEGNDCQEGAGTGSGQKPAAAPSSPPAREQWSPGRPVASITNDAVNNPPVRRSSDGKQIISRPDGVGTFKFAGREFTKTNEVAQVLVDQQAVNRGTPIDSGKKLSSADVGYLVESHVKQTQEAMARGIRPAFYSPEERRRQIVSFGDMVPQVLGGRTATGALIEAEDAEHIFRVLQALTSPNAMPLANMQRTRSLMEKFFSGDGRITTSTNFGVTAHSIRKGLSRYQTLIDTLGKRTDGSIDVAAGIKRANQMLTGQTMRAGDVDEFFRDVAGGEKGQWKPTSYLVGQHVPVFCAFGPKVGTFFANNNGELDHLTADVWYTRTWGRQTGELILPVNETAGKERAIALLKAAKKASADQLHGHDGNQLLASIEQMKSTGVADDVVLSWATERLKHYAKGDFKEKRGTGGALNRVAKSISESDGALMGDPGSGTRRSNMISVAREAAQRVGQPVAYVQDILWQDEQDAYAAYGAKTATSVGALSLYSDVIEGLAKNSQSWIKAESEKRSEGFGQEEYDDFERGGREQILFEEALADVPDDLFVETLIKYLDRSAESRSDDCGRQDGGRFGQGNDCASDDGGPTISSASSVEVTSGKQWRRVDDITRFSGKDIPTKSLSEVKSVAIFHGKLLSDSLKSIGVTLDEASSVCGSTVPGSDVMIMHGTIDESAAYFDDPSSSPDPKNSVTFFSKVPVDGVDNAVSVGVTLTRDDEDYLTLNYGMLDVSEEAKASSPVSIARQMMRSVADSISKSEKIGVDEIQMLAAGSAKDDSKFRGYRIWPRMGFDGVIPRKYVTPTWSATSGFFNSYGSKIPDKILSPQAIKEKKAGELTVQALYETKDGQEWWEANGGEMNMSLYVGHENELGWQRFSKMRGRYASRSMSDIEFIDWMDAEWRSIRQEVESRTDDCGRQEGGKFGSGNNCAKDDGGSGEGVLRPATGGSSTINQAPPKKPSWMGQVDATGSTKHGDWFLEQNKKGNKSPGHDEATSHIVSLVDGENKVKAFSYVDLSGDKTALYVNYSHVDEPFRGQGVYKSLLDSMSEQFDVISDEQHNVATAAKKAYESLGARLNHYDQYVLEKKRRTSRAFCPTGDGGGIKNDCNSSDDDLLKSAVTRWKGFTSEIDLHLKDELSGKPSPSSASGLKMREQAKAILNEVVNNGAPAPTLYRGDNKPPSENDSTLLGWTADKKVAEKWAKKYDGEVYTLKDATGLDLSRFGRVGDGADDFQESEWIVLNNHPKKDSRERRDEDCGRQDGGRFGQGNDCAGEGDGSQPDSWSGNESILWPASSRETAPPPFKGAEDYGTVSISAPAKVRDSLKQSGVSIDDAVAIAGGAPGSEVFVRPAPDFTDAGQSPVLFAFQRDLAGVKDGVSSSSVVASDATGGAVVYHSTMTVADAVKSDPVKRHAAAREFYRAMVSSVEAARKAGVSRISLSAAGNSSANKGTATDWKGYTIWPRMGFNAKIPPQLKAKLPPELSHAETLLDLHATREGTKWWAQNGEEVEVSLDLKDRKSPQNQVFDRFVRHFSESHRGIPLGSGDDWLSPEDMLRLDEMWEEIWDGELLDDYSGQEDRAFCATGEGGGIENTCGSGGGASWGGKPAPWGKDSGTEVWTPDKPLFRGSDGIGEIRINRASDVKGIVQDSLGLTVSDVLLASGAVVNSPDRVGMSKARVVITPSVDDSIDVSWFSKGRSKEGGIVNAADASRSLNSINGKSVLTQNAFFIHRDFQGKGIALESVLRMTSTPVDRITMTAARDDSRMAPGYRMNGYAHWPRYGYDAPISKVKEAIRVSHSFGIASSPNIPKEFAKAKTLMDIYAMPGGREWWTENGGDISLSFDTRSESRSRLVLMAEQDKAKKRFSEGRSADLSLPEGEIDEEAILDEVWGEILKNGLKGDAPTDEEWSEWEAEDAEIKRRKNVDA